MTSRERIPWAAIVLCGVAGCSGPSPDEENYRSWKQVAPHLFGQEFRKYAPFETFPLPLEGAVAEISLPAAGLPVTKEAVSDWVRTAAKAVSAYYGEFPVSRVSILVVPEGEGQVESGKTFGGCLILIKVGGRTTPADLRSDWTLTHEMFHLAFPDLERPLLWMGEGMATYLEPIARARVGDLPAEKVWEDLVEGIPKGIPEKGGEGLNLTNTWGATYWGGALFWLLADLDIREQSGNRLSVDDALRAVLRAGGNGCASWSAEQVLEAGDGATGLHVLRDLYERMGKASYRPDLEELWRRCGLRRGPDHQVVFDAGSPQSALRRSMTSEEKTALSIRH